MRRFVDGVQVLVGVATVVTVALLFIAEPTVATDPTPDVSAGAGIFSASCAGCHSSDGSGGVGPALAGEGALSRFSSAEEVARFVAVGSPGSMPGFETRLTPDEVNAVAEFVWSELAGR